MSAAHIQIPEPIAQIAVCSPYDGATIGHVDSTGADQIEALVARAQAGAIICRALPRHRRATILEKAAHAIESRREEFARLIVQEAGKTIIQARKEASRCVNTLKLSAEETKRNAGEVIPFVAGAKPRAIRPGRPFFGRGLAAMERR